MPYLTFATLTRDDCNKSTEQQKAAEKHRVEQNTAEVQKPQQQKVSQEKQTLIREHKTIEYNKQTMQHFQGHEHNATDNVKPDHEQKLPGLSSSSKQQEAHSTPGSSEGHAPEQQKEKVEQQEPAQQREIADQDDPAGAQRLADQRRPGSQQEDRNQQKAIDEQRVEYERDSEGKQESEEEGPTEPENPDYQRLLDAYAGKVVHGSRTLDESYYHSLTDHVSRFLLF
ncbi:hypothetical protein M432DRAFT_628380 [Thermoascus aurantiacus ATCC 26904]